MNENKDDDEREVTENEVWYDAEIAPKLLDIANQCGERKISFLAVVEYNRDDRARTQRIEPEAGLGMIMAYMCAASAPNIDSFIINLIRYCNEKGVDTSQSMFMKKINQWLNPVG